MSNPNENRSQLEDRFGHRINEELTNECLKLCKDYNISGDDLFFKWESLNYGFMARMVPITPESIVGLRDHLHREAQKALPKPQKQQRLQSGRNALNGAMSRNLGFLGRPSLGVKQEPKIEQKFTGSSAVAGPSKVTVSQSERRAYKYMYERVLERSGALDDQIDEAAELVQAFYEVDELSDPATSTEDEVTIVGRITLDSDSVSAAQVKLNEASLALESSRAMGAGVRVPLKFDSNVRLRGAKKGAGGAGFFPGAIVALRGRNGVGGWFNVTEVLPLPPLPAPDVSSSDPSSFNVSVACGPFTADSDLKYEPWKALLTKWQAEKPEIIIIIGPFIDCTHISIKTGDIDMTPTELVQSTIVEPLQQLLDTLPGTTVVVVPSVRDLVSDHAVFPQAELGANVINDSRIYSLPNPCRFALNGTLFAISSVDVLFHLRKEEFFRPMSEINPLSLAEDETLANDAMGRLCRHVLQQRSFYPIFPPPLDLAHEVNLDVSHYTEGLRLVDETYVTAPSVLILPSKLKQFHKIVDETTVLNPSLTNKGTYTNMCIENGKVVQVEISKHSSESTQVEISKHSSESTQVEISKHSSESTQKSI